MEISFEKKLSKIDLMDVYHDIADIKVSSEQVIVLCRLVDCGVNIRSGNVVYAVEKKFKHILENYKASKRLKWLNVNLKAIVPNAEEKIIKWQQKQSKKKKHNWINRKLNLLEYFYEDQIVFSTEELPRSPNPIVIEDRRLTSTSQASKNNCSDGGYTTSESVQTVIASQPRNTEETIPSQSLPFKLFDDISRATIGSSEEISISPDEEIDENLSISTADTSKKAAEELQVKQLVQGAQRQPPLMPFIQESDEFLTQGEVYETFYQDMHVTSTQEFG